MHAKRIKLVIVVNDFLVGGAQRLIVELLLRFNRSRFDIVLVTLMQFKGRDTMYHLLPDDIAVHQLAFKGFADSASWVALGRLLKKERPDVVLSHLFFSNTVVRLLNMFVRYRTITVEHNTYVGNTQMQVWCDRWLSRFSYRVVAVSRTVMEFASRQQRVPREKFIVIRNGVDVQALSHKAALVDVSGVKRELQVAPDDKILIAVGRLTGQKAPLLLIEGFARFAPEHPAYHLVVLGDGALRKDMEARAHLLGVATRVHFLGNVPDVLRYYAAAECLVSTSIIEGLSMAHLEALACRVPLLATRTSGSEELIEEGKNGYFIPEGTPEAVAAGLVKICGADSAAMRKSAYETARRYDIQTTVEQYEQLIEETYGQ